MADSDFVVHRVVGSANNILAQLAVRMHFECSVRCAVCGVLQATSLDSVRSVLRPVESAHTGEQ